MPRFAYKAMDDTGQETFGIVEAESQADAVNEVGRKGLFVTDVHQAHMGDELKMKWVDQKEQRRQQEEQRHERVRARHPKQRMVVRYVDGRTEYGVCYAMNPAETTFHLDKVDTNGGATGETLQVRFTDLKAVFQVKSFDGKFDKNDATPEPEASSLELVVEFEDGEILRGYAHKLYNPDQPRFMLIPREKNSNNIAVLVERAAVQAVYSVDEYKNKLRREQEALKQNTEGAALSQEETTGDFYFETRNYTGALEQYELAARKTPDSARLRKKIMAARFNVGIQFIKTRSYAKALVLMESVLKLDPGNAHAKKKVLQLRKIVEKEQEGKGGQA